LIRHQDAHSLLAEPLTLVGIEQRENESNFTGTSSEKFWLNVEAAALFCF